MDPDKRRLTPEDRQHISELAEAIKRDRVMVVIDGLAEGNLEVSAQSAANLIDSSIARKESMNFLIAVPPELSDVVITIRDQRVRFERWLQDLVSHTPDQETLVQTVARLQRDPEYKNTIQRLIGRIDSADIAELSKWGLLVLAAAILFYVADWPVTRNQQR